MWRHQEQNEEWFSSFSNSSPLRSHQQN